MEPERDSSSSRVRAGRALSVIATSLTIILLACILYLRPDLVLPVVPKSPSGTAPRTVYSIASIEFVTQSVGWLVAQRAGGGLVLLHTADGGRNWTRQLSVASVADAMHLQFFDRRAGVLALVGARPTLYRTSDGGRTWNATRVLGDRARALSWSFVDPNDGWMLATKESRSPAYLFRTRDGGQTWSDLGPPVAAPDQAFGVQFTSVSDGWLATAGSGAYAYGSSDSGATWTRRVLPTIRDFPRAGRFFVDVQRTASQGAVASVVAFTEYHGRLGGGGSIRRFPPLAVPLYDGSRPNNYIYQTLINQVIDGPFSNLQAPETELLSTVDGGTHWAAIHPPSPTGALGYVDAVRWWWVNKGRWATSSDAGVTWTAPRKGALSEPMPGTLQVLESGHGWYAGLSSDSLLVTADGGDHWSRLRPALLQTMAAP